MSTVFWRSTRARVGGAGPTLNPAPSSSQIVDQPTSAQAEAYSGTGTTGGTGSLASAGAKGGAGTSATTASGSSASSGRHAATGTATTSGTASTTPTGGSARSSTGETGGMGDFTEAGFKVASGTASTDGTATLVGGSESPVPPPDASGSSVLIDFLPRPRDRQPVEKPRPLQRDGTTATTGRAFLQAIGHADQSGTTTIEAAAGLTGDGFAEPHPRLADDLLLLVLTA